jgi:inhibitor of KinA sporulation pathway (predicted exonuclease)
MARGWSRPGEHRELVQIGAVHLDAGKGFSEIAALDIVVRPERNPVLSDYFVALTGITNERVAAEGTDLPAALDALARFPAARRAIRTGPMPR